MRQVELKHNPNGVTRILVDGVELKTSIDPARFGEYHTHPYTRALADHIIQDVLAKLAANDPPLDHLEQGVIIKYMKQQLRL